MTPVVTAPEDNRNFFILKPLLDEVVDEFVMFRQMANLLFTMWPQMELVWLCLKKKCIPWGHY
jgi:hypothetical protein